MTAAGWAEARATALEAALKKTKAALKRATLKMEQEATKRHNDNMVMRWRLETALEKIKHLEEGAPN